MADFELLHVASPPRTAWRSRWTSRCRPPRTIRGSRSTRTGSPPAPTDRSPTRRTRRRSTRTSTPSPSTTTSRASSPSASGFCALWMGNGVRIFRVDNPHTKAVEFWEVLFARIYATDPDVIFLAEAFTLPGDDAHAGHGRVPAELHVLHVAQHQVGAREYFTELSTSAANYMRPNCFVNTPDITRRSCSRATRRPSRSGRRWRRCSRRPTACTPGSRSTSTRCWRRARRSTWTPRSSSTGRATGRRLAHQPHALHHELNGSAREHPALQELRNLRFQNIDNSQIIAFSKAQRRRRSSSWSASLDPNGPRRGHRAPGPGRPRLRPGRAGSWPTT